VLLGVDRLDYTKGIDVRLRAIKELLDEGDTQPSPGDDGAGRPTQPRRRRGLQHAARRGRPLVGEINGDHGRVGFPVVHYIHQNVDFAELLAMYRAADVMLVTPFRDGMNLVAKEYVATRYDLTGSAGALRVRRRSHRARRRGARQPLRHRRPQGGHRHAVAMEPTEARQRIEPMRAAVLANDAVEWAKRFLADLARR
jgi:trehalose 6-phosphate synthase